MLAAESPQAAGPVRCAIYTRKSTEEGLAQDFNTLDAPARVLRSLYPESVRRRLDCTARSLRRWRFNRR